MANKIQHFQFQKHRAKDFDLRKEENKTPGIILI